MKNNQKNHQHTRRAISGGMEKHLYKTYKVLDHGFVRVVDYMGNDTAITQAARVSYGTGTKGFREDCSLIRYLMCNRHSTPFEMCEVKFHIKLPIFVARQWVRHRTANINEYSARYSILDKEFYIPDTNHLLAQSKTNRQGRQDKLPLQQREKALEFMRQDSDNAYAHYLQMIAQGKGLARELARINLPMNIYTQWYWKIDLHNLLHFLHLRNDSHAQYEIQVYANKICQLVQDWVPITYAAFKDYRLNSVVLSQKGAQYLQRQLDEKQMTKADSGMSNSEWQQFEKLWKISIDNKNN